MRRRIGGISISSGVAARSNIGVTPWQKIWIKENGQKKIEVAWSELTVCEEEEVIKAIDEYWDELNLLIDDVFAGKKIRIKRIK